jgi:hypothetical protein
MERVQFDTTYGYRDFISEEERIELENWIMSEKDKMGVAAPVNNEEDQLDNKLMRHLLVLRPEDEKPEIFHRIRNRLIEIEKIKNPIPAPVNYDWIGIVGKGSYVEPHYDDNLDEDHFTVRYNVIISKPGKGGRPIYDGDIIPFEERMVWRCDAGLVRHESEKVKDDKFRVNLSFGFSFEF